MVSCVITNHHFLLVLSAVSGDIGLEINEYRVLILCFSKCCHTSLQVNIGSERLYMESFFSLRLSPTKYTMPKRKAAAVVAPVADTESSEVSLF